LCQELGKTIADERQTIDDLSVLSVAYLP